MKTGRIFIRAGILALAAILLFSSLPGCASAEGNPAEERVFVATADWVPPEIDVEEALQNEPWLLVLKIAQEEIGYVEGPRKNESKYGEWFGNKFAAWCSEFVTWCVNAADERYGAGLMSNIFPYTDRCRAATAWFLQRERFIAKTGAVPVSGERMWMIGADRYLEKGEYIPYPGDYMWTYYYSLKEGPDHVTIVEGVSVEPDGSYLVHVIEGNNPDRVQRNTVKLTGTPIYGFGTPVRRANKAIRRYTSSNDVIAVQQYLYELGYLRQKDVTSTFSTAGEAAVRKYQKANGIKSTGQVDLETRTVMEEDPRFLELIAQYQQ